MFTNINNYEWAKETISPGQIEGILKGQSHVLELLASGKSLTETLDSLVTILESQLIHSRCSILILDKTGQYFSKGASPSLPSTYCDAIDGLPVGPNIGPCAMAAFKNEIVIIENIETETRWPGFKELALSHNLKACWSTPIRSFEGKVIGTLCPYYEKPFEPTENEFQMVKHAAYLAGIAIQLKQGDEVLQEKNRLLEMEVKKRKQIQKELVKSYEEAQASNRAKSDFLSKMSHELRTPMNSIIGFAQILNLDKKLLLSKIQKENLQFISSAGEHLLELINEILDLSTIESGNLKLFIEPVDIVPIINEVISISQPLADKEKISLESLPIPDNSFIASVDSLRIKQVLLNLTSNGIKYNKPNGSVKILCEKLDTEKIRIGVKDTGHGINDDQKDKIFKPFERFDLNADDIEGTGIGLTISKQLIELMHGAIGFQSVSGEGSFFYIDIPISEQPCAPIRVEKEIDSIQSIPRGNGIKKILYIEDIKTNIYLVEQILTDREDLELISAHNGMEGIKIAQTQIPDLILMDMNLPDIDGFTAYEKLQTITTLKNIPVIALTADAMDINIQKALDMGFKDYITKPIRISKIMNIIDQAFS